MNSSIWFELGNIWNEGVKYVDKWCSGHAWGWGKQSDGFIVTPWFMSVRLSLDVQSVQIQCGCDTMRMKSFLKNEVGNDVIYFD